MDQNPFRMIMIIISL